MGFTEVALQKRFDAFRATSKEKVARKFGVRGVNISAVKPLQATRSPRAATESLDASPDDEEARLLRKVGELVMERDALIREAASRMPPGR